MGSMQSSVNNSSPLIQSNNNLMNQQNQNNVQSMMNNLNLLNLNVMQPPANLMPINVQNVPLTFAVPTYSPSMPLVGQIPQYPMQGQMGYIIPPPQLMNVGLNAPSLFGTNNTPPPQQQNN